MINSGELDRAIVPDCRILHGVVSSEIGDVLSSNENVSC